MSVKYFAKVIDMQQVELAVAHSREQESALRDQHFERCSQAFYESILREEKRKTREKAYSS